MISLNEQTKVGLTFGQILIVLSLAAGMLTNFLLTQKEITSNSDNTKIRLAEFELRLSQVELRRQENTIAIEKLRVETSTDIENFREENTLARENLRKEIRQQNLMMIDILNKIRINTK